MGQGQYGPGPIYAKAHTGQGPYRPHLAATLATPQAIPLVPNAGSGSSDLAHGPSRGWHEAECPTGQTCGWFCTDTGCFEARQIENGLNHTCAVMSNGTVLCWGDNISSQLGNGTSVDSSVPVLVSGLTDAIQVSPGNNHTCALRETGEVMCWGLNHIYQLGNGTTQNVVTPTQFILPAGARAQAMYSNFLSVGYALFAVTQDGRLFGAGNNDSGQLGNGTVSATQSTPVQFGLPSGVTARYVALLRQSTFVIGSDNNIYSAGACAYGQLGSGYTISGCTNRSTRVRVALPTVNTSQPNTLPVVNSDWVQSTNLAADRHNVYVRMQGGAVYGWGANEYGQLGNGTTTDSATPVKIGTWGDAGQPQATQLAYDGETLYVLDSSGQVHAVGKNNLGSLAGAKAPIMGSTGFCLDNPGNTSTIRTRIRIYTCNNSTAQKLEWTSEGELKFRPNSSSEFCVDNANNSSANGNPIQLYTCNGTVAQKWQYRDDGSIYHPSTGRCIDNPGNSASSGTEIQLYQCNATPAQAWNLQPTLVPERVPIPASSGRVTRITTDQWSTLFLTEDGKVWGAGGNERGMLGRGSANVMNPALSQFILPSGRTAVDFYTTKAGVTNSEYGNTYVILDDGSVYGAGANTFGQLGIGTTSTQENTPRRMNLPSGVRARSVQSGLGTTLVLTDQGRIYTVGNNQHGQLGDGTTNNSSTPKANIYTNVVPVTYY